MNFIKNILPTNTMDYSILDYSEAVALRDKEGTKFVMNIHYNLSTVFQLEDSSYLVMPINRSAKSLLAPNKMILDEWIEKKYYPTNEEINEYYFENKEKIDNLPEYKEELKSDLIKYIYGEAKSSVTAAEIDNIYKLLKKRKKINQYRLHFHLLIGDFLINSYPNLFGRWGLIHDKQFLNPYVCIVVVSKRDGVDKYTNIERYIIGKGGYIGSFAIQRNFEDFSRLSNEIVELTRIF